MKHLLLKAQFALTFIFMLLCLLAKAQVKTKIFKDVIPVKLIPTWRAISNEITLDSPKGFEELKGRLGDTLDNKFAISLPVDINLIEEGVKYQEGNYQVYALRIIAKDALNISLEFGSFQLSENSILAIYNNQELTDSITSKENNENNMWATRVYQGDSLILVLKEPLAKNESSIIKISKVNFGYKKYGIQYGNPGASAPCEINVSCALGNGWDNEKNAVALIVANGSEACTGSLVMNTCGTNIPYLLTANHCLQAGNVNNWVFQFQYWSTTCTPNSGWNEDIQFNGCNLRANNAASDFALLELNQTPATNSGINYAGWSRNTNGITQTTIIHHPVGDLMKITRDNDAPTMANFLGASCWHLIVDNGTTEGGSSGSPYFDHNHRIIGQHYGIDDGNLPICNQVSKYGGRFDVSWTGGGTNATRLSNWLDPNNTGTMTTNTTNVSALINPNLSLSITGNNSFCSGTSNYTVNGVPAGANVTWTSSNAYIATVTPNGNPATVTKGNGYGNVTITATVGGSCFTNNIVSKTIAVGFPDTTNITFAQPAGQPCLSSHSPTRFVILNSGGTTTPIEVASAAANTIVAASPGGGNTTVTVPNFWVSLSSGSSAYIKVRLQNSCGWSDWKYLTIPPCSGSFSFAVYPNPATNTITIQQKEETGATINEVRIFDNLGNLKKQSKYSASTKQAQMNIAGLMTGIYFIEISSGKNKERQQLIIQK